MGSFPEKRMPLAIIEIRENVAGSGPRKCPGRMQLKARAMGIAKVLGK